MSASGTKGQSHAAVPYESIARLIRPHFDFEIRDIEILGSGADSAAYLVNSKWVVRIPQNGNARQALLKEIQVLPVLAQTLTVKIPDFEVMDTNHQECLFSIYKIIRGQTLSPELFFSLNQDVQESLIRELFDFLEQLHAVTLATVPALKVEASIGAYNPLQRHFHRELEDLLTRDEVQKIERLYQVFEADQRNQLLMPSVIHSDLKPAHVLVNDSSGHLSGVLDWGDACLGDPDFDFACVQIFFGSEFLLRLLSLAPQSDRERVLRKTPFFILVRALQDVIFSKNRHDQRSVTMGLCKLRAHLSTLDRISS